MAIVIKNMRKSGSKDSIRKKEIKERPCDDCAYLTKKIKHSELTGSEVTVDECYWGNLRYATIPCTEFKKKTEK